MKATIPSQFLLEAGLIGTDDYRTAMEEAGYSPARLAAASRRRESPPTKKAQKKTARGRAG